MCTCRKYILAFLLLISGHICLSQQKAVAEPQEVFLQVMDAYTRNDSTIIRIKGGTTTGVSKGLSVRCFKATEEYGVESNFREIAAGVITSTAADFSECYVQFYQANDELIAGDIITVKALLPATSYKSIFYELAAKGIEFVNKQNDFFYTLSSLLVNDSKKNEEALKQSIITDFKAAYEEYKDNPKLAKLVLTKIKSGRFKDKVPFEMLNTVSMAELNSFLLYVKTYSRGYVGKNYWMAQSFMGWVVSNAPYSHPEVKAALYPIYKNKEELRKKLAVYKADIIAEKSCESFAEAAVIFSDKLQFDSAYKAIDFAKTIAYAISDTFGIASAHFLKAQVDQDMEKYSDAIKECDNALMYAGRWTNLTEEQEVEIKKLILKAFIKKGYCQYKVSLYKEAVQTLAIAQEKLDKYRSLIGEATYKEVLQKKYEYEASIQYETGDYRRAIVSIDSSIRLNILLNSADAKNRNARNYWFKGTILNKQAKLSEALESFSVATEIYKSQNDERNTALVVNDIGDTYYDLAEYRKSIGYLESANRVLIKYGNNSSAGYSKSLMGNAYWQLGKYDSAILAHKEAIKLREGNRSGLAYSWRQLGGLYVESGLKNDAIAAYKTALVFSRALGDSIHVAHIYSQMGIVYHNDEHYSTAVDYYERAKKISAETPAYILYNLANAWKQIDTAKAKMYYEECEKLSRRTNDNQYLFSSLLSLSELAYSNNETAKGNTYFTAITSLSKQMGSPQNEAARLSLKGYSYINQLDYDSALYYYQLSLQLLDTVSKDGYIYGLLAKADVHISKGEFRTADSLYAVAKKMAIQTSNKRALGITLASSSFLYALLGEFDKGITDNDSAAVIFGSTGNIYRMANTYNNRAAIYKGMGRYKESIQTYLLADSIYIIEKTTEERGTVLNNIGVTYYNQGDYEKAIEYFNKAAKYINPKQVSENYILNKGNLAECYYYLNKKGIAKKILLETFPLATNTKRLATGMAIVLGQIYFDADKRDSALYYLQLGKKYSFESGAKEMMIKSLVWLAKIEAANTNEAAAQQYFTEATTLVKRYRIAQGWEPFYEQGVFFYKQKKFEAAIASFKEAVEMVEKNSENVYGGEEARKLYKKDSRKFDLYSKLISALAETNQVEEAWVYANKSNITGMKELLGGITKKSGDPKKDAAIQQAGQLVQQQNTIDNNIKNILAKPEAEQNKEQLQGYLAEKEIVGAKYIKFIEELKLKYKDINDYFGNNVDPIKFKKYKGELPADMAVVLYVVNENQLLTFTLTNENLSIHITDLKTDFSKLIKQFTGLLKNKQAKTGTGAIRTTRSELDDDDTTAKGSFTDCAATLYSYLISKIEPSIQGKQKLCIIPNGDLSKIPFQAIGKKMADSSFRFLTDDHTIFYTNQLEIFKDEASPKEDIASFAAFGVPDKTLRYTQKEAEAIGAILSANNNIYTGNNATEKMAKSSLSGKKYVHFATHGVLNYAEYAESFLKFLPDKGKDTIGGNDGKLTIDEIKELEIDGCDLVTLSACETAVGKQLMPGWQISPANSFILNKVKTVVATLWKVDDEATSILMDEFYLQLKNGREKADALREAQKKLSSNPKYVHPFYWAPFVLYGDWR